MIKQTISIILVINLAVGACFSQIYVSTYSGSGSAGFNNGNVSVATFNSPFGMCIDKFDNLYISDAGNNCIRKINTVTGEVLTLAGTGAVGWKDDTVTKARFNSPADLCVDDSGNVYVSDFLNQRIRKISFDGFVTTIAGTGTAGYTDGISTVAKFNYPRGICRDTLGNLYVADSWNHRIRKIDTLGNVTTYAGSGSAMGVGSTGSLVDGADSIARFFTPSGLSIDKEGNIYVADAYNHRIRMIGIDKMVSTFAGSGAIGVGNGGFKDTDSTEAILNTPTEVFVDTATDELYIGDTFNNRVRKVNMLTGFVSTYAGTGHASYIDSLDTLSTFDYPRGIVVSHTVSKKVYVNDYNNDAIRLIEFKGIDGVKNYTSNNHIIIYPNPSCSVFSIDLLDNQWTKFEIINLTGYKIVEGKIESINHFRVDLSEYSSGIYFLKLKKISGEFLIKKIIKE